MLAFDVARTTLRGIVGLCKSQNAETGKDDRYGNSKRKSLRWRKKVVKQLSSVPTYGEVQFVDACCMAVFVIAS